MAKKKRKKDGFENFDFQDDFVFLILSLSGVCVLIASFLIINPLFK